MSADKIVRMANDIAKFMESKPHAEGVSMLAAHINDFWEPRMRRQLFAVLDAGGEVALLVAQHGHHPGLVVRGQRRQAVTQAAVHAQHIVDEAVHRVARGPAAAVLQGLRQVPVVQGQVRLQAAREHAVDQAVVEGQALLVPGPLAERLHARPRH